MNTDWTHLLAQQFLDASASCGASCGRRQVIPWGWQPPGGCDGAGGCSCTLTAAVLGGYQRPRGSLGCNLVRVATIELVLDVCAPKVERDGWTDIPKNAGAARDLATLQWQILSGLMDWWKKGQLCAGGECIGGDCSQFSPGPWVWVANPGNCLRYKMTWTYTEDVVL
jgi:hypothetical protein